MVGRISKLRILSPALLFVLAVGCSGSGEPPAPLVEKSIGETDLLSVGRISEGSGLKTPGAPAGEVNRESMDHPRVAEEKKIERRVIVPDGVDNKWKAVKILVKNKLDEEKTEVRMVKIGASFLLGDSGIKVTVGPFFPNFVMNETSYTSMNNQLINPAVQLVVEEKGKISYKGWAFEKYPSMYAYEHEVYSLELMDYIPADVS